MHKISVQTGGIDKKYNYYDCYRIIKEAGFDGADVSFDSMIKENDIVGKNLNEKWLTKGDAINPSDFEMWKNGAKDFGVENLQAHAPFPGLINADQNYNDSLVEMLKKFIAASDCVGCRKLVIHPFFLPYGEDLSPEEEWNTNIRAYSELIETAKKYDVMILLENMFVRRNNKRYEACCSNLDNACRYIDELNRIAGEKRFGFCLDTGHLLLLGKNIKQSIVKMGNRIEALHIHDNNGIEDQHLAPYMGILDWNLFTEGLKEINYKGTLSFETHKIFDIMDSEVAEQMLKVIAFTGRLFSGRIEN